jgi:hypothetical protein
MRWAGHVECKGVMRYVYDILTVKLKDTDHLGDRGINGSIILKDFIKKQSVRGWTGSRGRLLQT